MFVEELQKFNSSNYGRFSCIDAAYADFLNKLMKVVNEVAASKGIRLKNNTQKWFDREIPELIYARKKLFLKFKTSKLHINEENYKKLSIKLKILLGKRKQSSMKLTLYKKQINLRNFGKS